MLNTPMQYQGTMAAQLTTGIFVDLISLKWRVSGIGESLNPLNQEREFYVTLVDAAANDTGHMWDQRTFRISENQYDSLVLGDLISINLTLEESGEPGV